MLYAKGSCLRAQGSCLGPDGSGLTNAFTVSTAGSTTVLSGSPKLPSVGFSPVPSWCSSLQHVEFSLFHSTSLDFHSQGSHCFPLGLPILYLGFFPQALFSLQGPQAPPSDTPVSIQGLYRISDTPPFLLVSLFFLN